jgi:glutathione S-transferase
MSHHIVLHFAPGSCARVPLIALEEAGAPFETRLVAYMAGDHRKPEFLALNPPGKVPVLEIDGEVLTQNGAILTYLARRHPEAGLLPYTGEPL